MQNRSSFSISRQGEVSARRARNEKHAREEARVTYSSSCMRLTLRALLAFTLCLSPPAEKTVKNNACSSGEGTTNFLIHVARGWKQICS